MREGVQDELLRLASARDGRLSPEDVVEEARKKSSPLHECFTWDDTEAARNWRLNEARVLIRSVTIEVPGRDNTVYVVPLLVRDPSKDGEEQGYVTIDRLKTEREHAISCLQRELTWASSCVQRAEGISVALGLDGDVRKVKRALERVVSHVDRLQ